jgi:CcmD family protein
MTSNYTVLFVNIVIWAGLFFMLFRLDRRTRELENRK